MVLIDFLNHIFDYKGDHKIVTLNYENKELLSADFLALHRRIGIVCKTQNDCYISEQVQNNSTKYYDDKSCVELARWLNKIDTQRDEKSAFGKAMNKQKTFG